MTNPFTVVKRLVRDMLARRSAAARRAQRSGGLAAGSREDEIANASPERAGELAGHAVERVDT